MWLRKLRWQGTEAIVTVPVNVARAWFKRQVRHVEIELHGDTIVVRPLADEDLLRPPPGQGERS